MNNRRIACLGAQLDKFVGDLFASLGFFIRSYKKLNLSAKF